jgi:hypothetical protein
MKKKVKTGLKGFVKDACANYDKDGKCIFGNKCKVLNNEKCQYFEKSVLGPRDYKYRLANYDYEKLFEQYSSINLSFQAHIKIRRCECGAPLEHRKRFCNNCRRRRQKNANKNRQSRWRQNVTL